MRRVGPQIELLFFLGGISQYSGAAIAVWLFEGLPVPAVAFLRVFTAGVVLMLLRRPWRRPWLFDQLLMTAAFGAVLAWMNLVFYLAIDLLPLGNAVAIEFIGPVAVAALATRTLRSLTALLSAATGVVLLARVSASGSILGVTFAVLAALFWAGYIILGHRVAQKGLMLDGLALGTMMGAVAILPLAAAGIVKASTSPLLLGLGAVTGILSNVIPYGIDQFIMARITRRRFAILEAILPASAALIGAMMLLQMPKLSDLAGVGLVMAAILLAD